MLDIPEFSKLIFFFLYCTGNQTITNGDHDRLTYYFNVSNETLDCDIARFEIVKQLYVVLVNVNIQDKWNIQIVCRVKLET